MQSTDKSQFVEGLNACMELYGKPKVSVAVLGMWWEALKRFSLDEVSAGFNRHAQDPDQGSFVPKPADIIRNISGNTQTQGEQAWTKVDFAIRTTGPHQSVVFDDPIIHAVIADMGGWISLCMVDRDEYPFKHNEFVKRYRGYSTNPPAQIPRKLIGHAEQEFQMRQGKFERGALNAPEPVLIGNLEAAQKVYLEGQDNQHRAVKHVGALLPLLESDDVRESA